MNCLFCQIIEGSIPTTFLYEDEWVVAFRDIKPQAPTHILIIPRAHIATVNEIDTQEKALVGHMVWVAKLIAEREGFSEFGYRLVFNVNAGGGQMVYHIHLHVLGGRQMSWPPG